MTRALSPELGKTLLMMAVCIGSSSCNKTAEQDARTRPPLVQVAVVEQATAGPREYTGVVAARVQSNLGFRVGGMITARLVNVGQAVHKGDILMRLDPTDLALTVASREADVANARARSIRASADERRQHNLLEKGAGSAQAYDTAKADADAAAAELVAAEAAAHVATNANGYAELAADVDGIVVETMAEPGQVIEAGKPVVILAAAGRREAAINLPEFVRPDLGSKAFANLYGSSGPDSPAELRQLSDAADPLTRTYEARYVLEGTAANAPLGATITIKITSDNAPATDARIPIGAIIDQDHGTGVWVLGPDRPDRTSTVAFRTVKVRELGDETAVVSDGVHAGERVVALGAHLLHEGDQVRSSEKAAGGSDNSESQRGAQ